jgi:hypothetical protein
LKLQRVLAAAAIIGFVVPLTSYTEWWLLVQASVIGWGQGSVFGWESPVSWHWPPNLIGMVDRFLIQDVLLISTINVPLYAALVMVWWSVARMKRERR